MELEWVESIRKQCNRGGFPSFSSNGAALKKNDLVAGCTAEPYDKCLDDENYLCLEKQIGLPKPKA